jgi:nucleotide-binding universal stress UspA family protein
VAVPTLHRILVPIDFSASSHAALEYAGFLGGAVRAPLAVLHVWEPGGQAGPDALSIMPGSSRPPGWEQTRADVRREVERFIQAVQALPASIDVRVEAGQPVEAILAAAKAVHADLIVMGTHGRTGLSRILLGSVAEAVMRRAACPVLTIRAPGGRTVHDAPPV